MKSFKKPHSFQNVNKKLRYEKKNDQTPSGERQVVPVAKCRRCLGPHDVSACKWRPRACFSCGKEGHL